MVQPNPSTLPDTNYAPTYLIVTGVFTFIAVGLCGTRIYVHTRPKIILRVDDYLTMVPAMLCIGMYISAVFSSKHGWGHRPTYVPVEDQLLAMRAQFVQQVMWILAIAMVRISIAWSLLRLSYAKVWKWTLWAIIVIQITTYLVHMVFQFFNCRPLRANWSPVYDVRCWDRKHVLVFGWIANGLLVTIDFVLALMPVYLIRTLNRSAREKILLSCLMAMGVLAGAIAAYRISISDKTFSGELLSSTVMMSMWCTLELLLGLIAACMACLKAPAERLLRRIGFLARRFELTRPSFVLSLQDQDRHESSPSVYYGERPSSGYASQGSTNDTGVTKNTVSSVEVEVHVP